MQFTGQLLACTHPSPLPNVIAVLSNVWRDRSVGVVIRPRVGQLTNQISTYGRGRRLFCTAHPFDRV